MLGVVNLGLAQVVNFRLSFRSGSPLITGDTPAIRELLGGNEIGLTLVPSASAEAIAEAVLTASRKDLNIVKASLFSELCERITPMAIGGENVESHR